MLYIHEMFLVYKLETFKNWKELKHIMIMGIAIIYIFLILCDISSLAENYFQKILSPHPMKNSTNSFLLSHPLSARPRPFLPTLKLFQPACKVEDTVLSL